jgi:hypothetical protein
MSKKHGLYVRGFETSAREALRYSATRIHEKYFVSDDDCGAWSRALGIWARKSRAQKNRVHFCGGLCCLHGWLLRSSRRIATGAENSEQANTGQDETAR